MSSMQQIYSARKEERLTVEHFLRFIATRPGKPRVVLAEDQADLLGKLTPPTESHTELIDQWQGINREQLEAERAAAQRGGADCPCENPPP